MLLYPLGGYSEIEQEPGSPGREALISGAGPAVSLVIAGLGYLLAKVIPHGLPHQLIAQLFFANLIVGIFNLLPGLPLDGGRIFRAGVWKITSGSTPRRSRPRGPAGCSRSRWSASRCSASSSAGSFLSLYWLWLLVIAGFIWIQSTQAIRAAKIRERLPMRQRARAEQAGDPVAANVPLAEAVRRAQAAGARALVIVDHENTPTAHRQRGSGAGDAGGTPALDRGRLARQDA